MFWEDVFMSGEHKFVLRVNVSIGGHICCPILKGHIDRRQVLVLGLNKC